MESFIRYILDVEYIKYVPDTDARLLQKLKTDSSPQTTMTVPVASVDQTTLDMLVLHSHWRGAKQASTEDEKEGCDQGGRRMLPFLWRP